MQWNEATTHITHPKRGTSSAASVASPQEQDKPSSNSGSTLPFYRLLPTYQQVVEAKK